MEEPSGGGECALGGRFEELRASVHAVYTYFRAFVSSRYISASHVHVFFPSPLTYAGRPHRPLLLPLPPLAKYTHARTHSDRFEERTIGLH